MCKATIENSICTCHAPLQFPGEKKMLSNKKFFGDEEEEEEGTNETDGDDLCKRIWGEKQEEEKERKKIILEGKDGNSTSNSWSVKWLFRNCLLNLM
jgi:hypothetical protein